MAHPAGLLAQVGLGLVQELLGDVHQVYGLEEGQQQPLGDAADARAAVQSAGCARLALAILGVKSRTTLVVPKRGNLVVQQ